MAKSTKPVIVISTFGTRFAEGMKDLQNIDHMIMARYPDYDVRWSFGGDTVREVLKKAGQTTLFERKIPLKNMVETYADLRKEGKFDVAVCFLFILPGGKGTDAHMTIEDIEGLSVEFGYTLFSPPDNVKRVTDALAPRFGAKDTVTIICAHGNGEMPTLNVPYFQMSSYLQKHYHNVFITTSAGPPGTDKAFAAARATGLKKVKFIPLLFVAELPFIPNTRWDANSPQFYRNQMNAGARPTDIIMGDSPLSYKNQLGLEATCDPGLGSNPEVMKIWLESIDWTLTRFKK